MYDMNACYKIIFKALAKDTALKNIAQQIYGYTKCGIAFVSGAGRLIAASGFSEEGDNSFSFVEKKHMSREDYELFFTKKKSGKFFLHTEPVYEKKQLTGYVLFSFQQAESQNFFEELGKYLAHVCARYYAKEQEKNIYSQSIRRHITAWTIMEDDAYIDRSESIREGKYILALFMKNEDTMQDLSAFLRENCGSAYVYEEQQSVCVLFYKLTACSAERIYKKIEESQLDGCVSEVFSDWHLCRAKQHLLERIVMTDEAYQENGIKREKEWFVPGVCSYAAPLIEEAGLTDYSIQRLIQEDEDKNTDLYHTLKIYLLCENNITVAAKKLHIHRNTLVYRLKQIENCLDVDFNDNESSRDLLAFIMMYDMARQKQETGNHESNSEFTGNI